MRKPCIPEIIYSRTFPKPKQGDPVSFYAHIQRYIVGEVRVEVQNFYGALDTLEAQYPGLDYSFAPHRRRLTRYPWHRRLFRVFDELSLTGDEILNLCQWEGTRAAKEKYEREAGVQVRTTTADDVEPAPSGDGPGAVFEDLSRPPVVIQPPRNDTLAVTLEEEVDKGMNSPQSTPEEDFIGQLRHAMQSRLRGDPTHVNQEWEQWLKETLEQHADMDHDAVLAAIQDLEPETFGASLQPGEGEETPLRSSTPQSTSESYQEIVPLERSQDAIQRASARSLYLQQRLQAETAR